MAPPKLSSNPKVLTANDLRRGDVVYFARDGRWQRSIYKARAFDDPDAAQAALARALQDESTIVGPFLTDILPGSENRPEPAHFREVFRQTGPSNYTGSAGLKRREAGESNVSIF